jgi:hypothetical protein
MSREAWNSHAANQTDGVFRARGNTIAINGHFTHIVMRFAHGTLHEHSNRTSRNDVAGKDGAYGYVAVCALLVELR